MRTITIEVPDHLPPEIAASTENLASAFRLAAAIFWYDRGLISQGKGAEIAGLTRAGFLKALRNVPETTSLFSRNMLSSPPLGAKQGGGQHGRLCTGNRTEDEAAL